MKFMLAFTLFALSACAPESVYIQGGPNASADIEANMSGGSIRIKGPFIYCKNRVSKESVNNPSLEGCVLIPQ